MQKVRTLLVASVFGLALSACQAGLSPDGQTVIASSDEELADESNIIVLLESEEEANTLLVNAVRRGYQLSEKKRLEGLDLVLLEFERPEGVSGPVAIGDMQRMAPSSTAGVDHFFTLQFQTDGINPVKARAYADDLVDWPEDGCPAFLSVGIIDGDVSRTAPRLAGVDIVKKDFTGGAPAAGDHGTAIADLLVGPGKLRDARLYAATVVSANAPSEGAGVHELILALDWMQASDVKLVNISLAGPYNALLDRVVKKAARDGMIIVAAVGNDGPNAEPRYPAAFEDVIAVTALDRSLEIYSQAVRGSHIDFAAPGVDVFVTSAEEGKYLSGTSVAAPFVTALIASDPSSKATDRTYDIRQHISGSTVDIGPAGRDPIFGRGLPMRTWECK